MKPQDDAWILVHQLSPVELAVKWFVFCHHRLARWAATISMLFISVMPTGAQEVPSPHNDAAPAPRRVIVDVRLDGDGALHGRLVSVLHTAISDAIVQLHGASWEKPRDVTSDSNGEFRFPQLSTGQFHLTCGNTTQLIRIWSMESAPPAALDRIVLVDSPTLTVRGQQPLCNLFCNEPIMIGVLVAAAIAIPLALHDSGDRANGS